MTIVSIRGTHGSGKSTIVRKLLDTYAHDPIGGPKKRPDGYVVYPRTAARSNLPHITVVGPYDTPCGGCDAVQPYDRILDIIKTASDYPRFGDLDVLFEGALVSSSYGRVGQLMEELANPIFAFLDTPLELCLERIALRREAKWKELGKPGSPPPVDPKNTAAKFYNVLRTKDQLAKLGSKIKIVDIDHRAPVKQVLALYGYIKLRNEP